MDQEAVYPVGNGIERCLYNRAVAEVSLLLVARLSHQAKRISVKW
jgi:hypothetical protein